MSGKVCLMIETPKLLSNFHYSLCQHVRFTAGDPCSLGDQRGGDARLVADKGGRVMGNAQGRRYYVKVLNQNIGCWEFH